VIIERRTADPLVSLELFRSRTLGTGVALAVLGGAARASTFVLVALYLQQALAVAPQQAGLAMVPTSITGFVVSLSVLPRMLRAVGPRRGLVIGLVALAAGHLWLAQAPCGAGYVVAVLPGLLLVAAGVALSFMPTTMVIASAVPQAHAGLASGLAGSATQVGAAQYWEPRSHECGADPGRAGPRWWSRSQLRALRSLTVQAAAACG
jgi:hypothetical protein